MRRVRRAWLAGLLAVTAGAAGCGWNRGLTVAEGVDSVGVEIFQGAVLHGCLPRRRIVACHVGGTLHTERFQRVARVLDWNRLVREVRAGCRWDG